ncbi:two-component sensor histidine kinase [Paenibacillus donghaensis]|uniref:histidine kinase n=2 Tax=Paenibacillus donghaensis TaxID=414771 RepID=A0A2Z2KTC8_9BACL|nr:two-component sensor histidine kinase [Paenibacillus donghaensis]
MLILGKYVDATSIPHAYVISVLIYWVFVAAVFTLFNGYQFIRRYHKPMEEFAMATRKVAGGDFSVYIPPRHLKDKMDYLDTICMDFNVMVEELGSIETLKTDFFSNVSHEIKTPLAIIQNYAEALKNEKLTPEQREGYIDTILDSSSRLSQLITNILKLNKLEKQNLQPISEPYDLCAQLCECALWFEELWMKKDIEFVADVEDRATIETDASLLEIIWTNLLSNAIKFTEPGGTVIMKQSSTDEEVIVSISDTGCGMSEDTMKHIFDKFYQGDTSHSTEGNGLGLALVLRILQLIGGSITVTSVPSEKTTFTVRIPVRDKTAIED